MFSDIQELYHVRCLVDYVGNFFKEQLEQLIFPSKIAPNMGRILKSWSAKYRRLTILDFEKAWKIQRIEMGLPTEIGKHEVKADLYAGMSDEKLVEELESLTERYKEKLKEKPTELADLELYFTQTEEEFEPIFL